MASSSPSLREKLTKELECSVCLEIYTDPKTLPCLHTFCRHCLNGLAERREYQEPIACPDCRTKVALPKGGNFDAFPSSFYLNRLRDILSPQTGHQVLCNSCDKKCAATAFCFDCECFICDECRQSHSRMKILRSHSLTGLSEAQDIDIKQIVGRPQLCGEPRHTGEGLKFFCEPCQQCICQTCAIMTHKNHEFVHVDDAADQAKLRLSKTNKTIQAGVVKLEEHLRKNQEANGKLEEEIAAAELSVQRNTQIFIELAKRHEREVIAELAAIREERERVFDDQKEKLELQLGQLRSVTDYLDSVLKRGISEEILQAEAPVSSRSGELLKTVEEVQPVRSERVKYVANEDVYKRVEQLTLGRVTRRRIPPSYKHLNSFGTTGSNEGQFRHPVDITVSSSGELEVSDHYNHRVQVFSSEGQFLRMFGRQGGQDRHFQYPSGVAYDKTGNILVGYRNNARIQVFSPTGQPMSTFGETVLKRPCGISVSNDNNTVVCDSVAKKVFMFSPERKLLLQFDSCLQYQGSPYCQYAIFHDEKYFVSAAKQVVRVFDARGAHLHDIGEGHLDTPTGLTIDADDLLLVGDDGKRCVQVFTSHGDFLTSFGSRELSQGSFSFIYGIIIGPGERVFVCRGGSNHCIQVYQMQY